MIQNLELLKSKKEWEDITFISPTMSRTYVGLRKKVQKTKTEQQLVPFKLENLCRGFWEETGVRRDCVPWGQERD